MSINLGNFSVCLNVSDIKKSTDFYKILGFKVIGGELEHGWQILLHGNCGIGLFQGHIKNNLLHFRGQDNFKLEKELIKRGLTPSTKAFIEEADNSSAMEFIDPDSNVIYFNTSIDDEPVVDFNISKLPSDDGKYPLGRFEMCLSCNDLFQSMDFYQKLGFEQIDGKLDEGWVILKHNNGIISLYSKETINMEDGNVLNFRGGDVEKITTELKSKGIKMQKDFKAGKNGGGSATFTDPDSNVIFLDTAPNEPKYDFNIDKL